MCDLGKAGSGRRNDPAEAMNDLPLNRYPLFESHDVEETRERVSRVFCDHELGLVGRDARIDSVMNCQRILNVAVAAITYGGDVRVVPGECESFFPVMTMLSGKGTFRCGVDSVHATPGLAAVASPTLPLSMRLGAGAKLVIARIERPALEAKLADMLGDTLPWPLEFTLGMDTTTGWGNGWYQLFALCAEEIGKQDPSWTDSLAARGLEQLLMEGLLLAQPSNYSRLLAGETRPVPNRAVSTVIEIIEAHPEHPYTVGSLARSAGVSARALQEGFRRHAGESPLLYLRAVRLQRAHDALRAAQPGTMSVGEIATQWGFSHFGRFAGWYRKRYGETPSQTLNKGRPARNG